MLPLDTFLALVASYASQKVVMYFLVPFLLLSFLCWVPFFIRYLCKIVR